MPSPGWSLPNQSNIINEPPFPVVNTGGFYPELVAGHREQIWESPIHSHDLGEREEAVNKNKPNKLCSKSSASSDLSGLLGEQNPFGSWPKNKGKHQLWCWNRKIGWLAQLPTKLRQQQQWENQCWCCKNIIQLFISLKKHCYLFCSKPLSNVLPSLKTRIKGQTHELSALRTRMGKSGSRTQFSRTARLECGHMNPRTRDPGGNSGIVARINRITH